MCSRHKYKAQIYVSKLQLSYTAVCDRQSIIHKSLCRESIVATIDSKFPVILLAVFVKLVQYPIKVSTPF